MREECLSHEEAIASVGPPEDLLKPGERSAEQKDVELVLAAQRMYENRGMPVRPSLARMGSPNELLERCEELERERLESLR